MAIGLFVLLKYGYTLSETSDLTFLLQPTSKVVELLTGSHTVYVQDSGYFFESLNVVIDKSCSGFNFWLLSFLMLTFLSLKYYHKANYKILAFIFSFVGAFLLTILVNSSRIFTAIIFEKQVTAAINIQQGIIHEALGIITNLTFLILTYLLVEKILNTKITNEKLA